jgi:membrane associated rhomboid family serine protease
MFPVSDNDPAGRRIPIANYLLIGINALVFIYQLTLGQAGLEAFFQQWGATPSAINAAFAHPGAPGSLHAFLTLITSQFIHAGWMHILGNMLFLYIFGDDIENLLGSVLYPIFYLVCGIVAGLVQTFVLTTFTGDVNTVGIGASGAIAGVMGAYLLLNPTRRINVLAPTGGSMVQTSIPAFTMLGFWFLQQLLSGVGALSGGASNVGFWAHIGGFIAGILLILPFRGRATTAGTTNPRAPTSYTYR